MVKILWRSLKGIDQVQCLVWAMNYIRMAQPSSKIWYSIFTKVICSWCRWNDPVQSWKTSKHILYANNWFIFFERLVLCFAYLLQRKKYIYFLQGLLQSAGCHLETDLSLEMWSQQFLFLRHSKEFASFQKYLYNNLR